MPSLLDPPSIVTANYLKTEPTTQFGTRALRFICVTVSGVNLATDRELSNSLYSKAVRALQVGVEVYAVFIPTATQFVAIIADDTANDSNGGPTIPGEFVYLAEAIVDAMGTGTAAITTGTWAGNAVTFA